MVACRSARSRADFLDALEIAGIEHAHGGEIDLLELAGKRLEQNKQRVDAEPAVGVDQQHGGLLFGIERDGLVRRRRAGRRASCMSPSCALSSVSFARTRT